MTQFGEVRVSFSDDTGVFVYIDCQFEVTDQASVVLSDFKVLVELDEETIWSLESLPFRVTIFYAPAAV